MFCKNCGAELIEGMKFCKNCGTPVETVAPEASVQPQMQQGQNQAQQPNINVQIPPNVAAAQETITSAVKVIDMYTAISLGGLAAIFVGLLMPYFELNFGVFGNVAEYASYFDKLGIKISYSGISMPIG